MIPQAITSRGRAFNPRMMTAAALCLMGVFLAAFSFGAPSLKGKARSTTPIAIGSTLPANALGNWAIVPSPNTSSQQLLSPTCISTTDCWAVGYFTNTHGNLQTLIEHWNGSAWVIVSSANTVPNGDNYLRSVACASASNCWAVGYHIDGPGPGDQHMLIEHWDGVAWSIVDTPDGGARRSRLYDVTCPSASECWAVGILRATTAGAREQTLIEHWNGSTWSIVASPNTSPTKRNFLLSISCASPNNCVAVGYRDDVTKVQTLVESWNGVSWSIVPSPNTISTETNFLNGVTCVSNLDCWAVGYYENENVDDKGFPITQTLIQHWDGAAWSIVSSPSSSPIENNYLVDVRCVSNAHCWAVGGNSTTGQALFEEWNGTTWTLLPPPSGSPYSAFSGITCSSSAECWASGAGDTGHNLVARWTNNAWAIVASPDASGGGYWNSLRDVVCNSTSDCWAVGDGAGIPYIQHWNGNSWSIASTSAGAVPGYKYLLGVACPSASQCWAVGYYIDDNLFVSQTFIEHWNGTTWSPIFSPSRNTTDDNELRQVACTSTSDCWAVGGTFNNDAGVRGETIIEHWDGTSWSLVSSPNPETFSGLNDVACTSASDCWATGFSESGSSEHTLIEHWDGSAWNIVPSPNGTDGSGGLGSVTCSSAVDCWAIGNPVLHWDGTSWSIVPTPAIPTADIACASASNCWTVGGSFATSAAHWDGTAWSLVSTPNVSGGLRSRLFGVTCPSAWRCWAVGDYQVENFGSISTIPIDQTLIEQFTAGLEITSSSRSHGQFSLTGQTVANASVNIQASPDLIAPFVTIDTVTANAAGAFEYIDPNSSSFQKRFYRAVFP